MHSRPTSDRICPRSPMKIQRYGTLLILLSSPLALAARSGQQTTPAPAFTVDQILGFPSPENLVASPVGSTIAWTFNERGVRNIYAADAPGFEPRRITAYREDDGQELTQLSFSRYAVIRRGSKPGASAA